MSSIHFLDVTNRNGVQTARTGLSKFGKVMVNFYLGRLGVAQSEIGFPFLFHEVPYVRACVALAEAGAFAGLRLSGWWRAVPADVEAAVSIVVPGAGLSAWELADLLGIHPHLVSGPHLALADRPCRSSSRSPAVSTCRARPTGCGRRSTARSASPRITRRSPRRAKQACDLRRYHFAKILGRRSGNGLPWKMEAR